MARARRLHCPGSIVEIVMRTPLTSRSTENPSPWRTSHPWRASSQVPLWAAAHPAAVRETADAMADRPQAAVMVEGQDRRWRRAEIVGRRQRREAAVRADDGHVVGKAGDKQVAVVRGVHVDDTRVHVFARSRRQVRFETDAVEAEQPIVAAHPKPAVGGLRQAREIARRSLFPGSGRCAGSLSGRARPQVCRTAPARPSTPASGEAGR